MSSQLTSHSSSTESGKALSPSSTVSSVLKSNGDVFIHVLPGAVADASSTAGSRAADTQSLASAAHSATAPAAGGGITGKPFKLYMHYEPGSESAKDRAPLEAGGGGDVAMTHLFRWDTCTGPKPLSDLLHEFCGEYATKNPGGKLLSLDIAVQTESGHVLKIEDVTDVTQIVKSGDDLFLVPADVARKTDNTRPAVAGSFGSAIDASRLAAGDKSYYYWKRAVDPADAAPKEEAKVLAVRAPKETEKVFYQTISAYSFENDNPFVKIYVRLPNIGAHPREKITTEFKPRFMCFAIHEFGDSMPNNWRLQVPLLSEEIDPGQCTVSIKGNTAILRLKKIKVDHHWYVACLTLSVTF
jgi:hypothetical protein